MADKEITTFVVDISSSMGESSSPASRAISDLELGLKYLFDVVSAKAVRGRKTDYVGVIAVHAPETQNPYGEDGDSFQNIEVVLERKAPHYSDLKTLYSKLTPNPRPNDSYDAESLGDVFEGLVLAVSLYKDTSKLKFTRNVVVITNGQSAVNSFDSPVAKPTFGAIEKLDINLTVIGVGFDSAERSETQRANADRWQSICKDVGGTFMTGTQALSSVLYNPPLKKVRPMKAYRGPLRLGADYKRLLEDKFGGNGDDESGAGSRRTREIGADDWSLNLGVECYPATKVESLPSGHSYFVDAKASSVSKIGQVREYYVENHQGSPDRNHDGDDDDDGEVAGRAEETRKLGVRHSASSVTAAKSEVKVETEPIDAFDRVKGFKYSNYDLVPLDADLESAATLRTFEGIDIVGFLKQSAFPYAFLTEESFYVVPESGGSVRSIAGFNTFCRALIELSSYALVRYVQKENAEVKMCILLPLKVMVDAEDYVYTCSMVRIPFREDEKIGRFPFLIPKQSSSSSSSKVKKEKGDSQASSASAAEAGNQPSPEQENPLNYPSEKTNSLMESFILARDLDGDRTTTTTSKPAEPSVSITKTISAAKQFSLLPAVPDHHATSPDDKLLSFSPAIHKFNVNLRRMIYATLSEENIMDALNDEDFVQKHLVANDDAALVAHSGSGGAAETTPASKKSTNLFNLRNVLSLNSSDDFEWLAAQNEKSKSLAKDLIKSIDVKYVTKEEADKRSAKRRKGAGFDGLFKRHPQGTFGANEGEYDQMPDLDNLLNS